MPAKEVSLNELKKLGSSKTLKKMLKKNEDYSGEPTGCPPGVVGEATFSSVKINAYDWEDKQQKKTRTMHSWNALAVVDNPSEYKGRQIYPSFNYNTDDVDNDTPDKFDNIPSEQVCRNVIKFLYNLGIPQAEIDTVKGSGESFLASAAGLLQKSTGRRFKFKTGEKEDKKGGKPTGKMRTVYYANGPIKGEDNGHAASPDASDAGQPDGNPDPDPTDAETQDPYPNKGETWTFVEGCEEDYTDFVGEELTVVDDTDRDDPDEKKTVILKPKKGPKITVNIFHGESPQVQFVPKS